MERRYAGSADAICKERPVHIFGVRMLQNRLISFPKAASATPTLYNMSIVSQNQSLQNQLKLQQLETQQRQQEQTKSFVSSKSAERANLLRKPTQSDPHDPLSVQVPISGNPTEVLASRFASWRTIIKCLLLYLRETVSVHEEVVRQQMRLQHAISFPFGSAEPQDEEAAMLNRFFLPLGNGSVHDLPSVLTKFHEAAGANAAKTTREVTQGVIPRLEDLRRDLLVKMREIRGLQSDFKNTIAKELHQTKHELNSYVHAIDISSKNASNLNPRHDPYICKLQLERQIKTQLAEENFLHEAYINLQTSGMELEKVVVTEIQNALTIYARLLGQEAQTVFDVLISRLDSTFLTKDPTFEWDAFIAKDSNFIEMDLPIRKYQNIHFPHENNNLSSQVCSGYLERRSKFLKSYSKGYYVLTPCFIHEFKSDDRKKDPFPLMSISLDECEVSEHSGKNDSVHRFVLRTKQNGLIHRGHNWMFRADSYASMMKWFNRLQQMTQLKNPVSRASVFAPSNPLRVDATRLPTISSTPIPADMLGNESVLVSDLNQDRRPSLMTQESANGYDSTFSARKEAQNTTGTDVTLTSSHKE